MPANGALPSRAEALAAAIDGARAALEQHLRDDLQDTAAIEQSLDRGALVVERPLLRAYRELVAASNLLKSRRPLRPAHCTTEHQPERLQIVADDTADDLTRIRGVDAAFAERLGSIGIQRFDQIAAWEPEDVPSIAQALDLGRDFVRHDVIEQAKMLLAERSARRIVTSSARDRAHGSVATWLPHDCEHVPRGTMARSVLTAEDIGALQRELRRGIGRNDLRSLADIAPAFAVAAAVAIPADHVDLFETEAEWRPIPLIALPQSDAVIDAEPPNALDRPLAVARIGTTPATEPTAKIVEAAVSSPSPLHVAAVARLDELEAEIDTLGTEPVIASIANVQSEPIAPTAPQVPSLRAIHGPATVDTPPRAAAVPGVETEEADVTITVHRAKLAAVAPMPELLLQPRRLVSHDVTELAKPVPNTEVSEAAVVIVKRRAAERAAPDLEFYKVPGGTGEPGPVRRLLRAVKVL